MTSEQAKEILMLYRPGTADAHDPSFAEALRLCERDPELQRWFAMHCAVYKKLRVAFRDITAPEALKEQILAERKVRTTAFWRRPVFLAAVAVAAVLIALTPLWLPRGESRGFADFREEMAGKALRLYAMQLVTKNPDEIRQFFARNNGITNYDLPQGLEKNAQTVGCVGFTWRGKPVSMICFQSGKPLSFGQSSDIWLFIVDHTAVPGTPITSKPQIAKINRLTTASWTANGRTYILAADGDEELLRRLL